MKAILKKFWLYLPMVMLFGAVGCSDDKEPVIEADPASITIDNVTTTSSSVRFTLTPEKAVRYTYEVALVGETGDVKEIPNGEASTQEVADLEADQLYFIKAIAYNENGKPSEEARHEFRTTALASVVIKEKIEVTVSSAKVTFVPTNAVSVSYTWYEAENKPAELNWLKKESNETFTVEISELKDDTDYVVEAFATNAEGDSETQTATFKTLALPTLTMALNAEELKAHSAQLTFTPANADGFAYAYYKAEERPEEPVFVPVTANKETVVTLNRLAANTAYMVEAYAFSGDYKTEVITLEEAFTTPEATEGLEVTIFNNGKVAYAEMYMNPEKITGYFYSTQFYELGGYQDFDTKEGWWEFEKKNAWWGGLNPTTKDYSMMSTSMMANKTYLFYTIEQVDGEWDESTIKEYKVTTGSGFEFKTDAMPEATYTPAQTSIAFDVVCSENSTVMLACCAPKATVDATEGGAQTYFSSAYNYVSRMIDVPVVSSEHTNLAPGTEYYVMVATLERDKKFSKLNVQTVKTLDVEPVEGVETTVELISVDFTSVVFDVAVTSEENVEQVRYKLVKKSEAGDEQTIANEVYGGVNTMSDYPVKSEEDANTYTKRVKPWERLDSGTEYKLFLAPMLSGQRFGKVVSMEFATDDLGKVDGVAKAEVLAGFNLSNGYVQVTFKPNEDCEAIIYKSLSEEGFKTNGFDRFPKLLAEHIAADSYATKIFDVTDESQLTNPQACYVSARSKEGNYIIALLKDKEGKFSTAYAEVPAAWTVNDTDLRKELLAYDEDGDNMLIASEIEAVTSLTLSDKTFTSMRGISYLYALETLELNNVTGGDWLFASQEAYREWQNPMPKLKTLKIENASGKKMTFIHIALNNCPELQTLVIRADGSDSSLTKLDISKNTELLISSPDNFYFPWSVTEVICNKDQEKRVRAQMADRLYEGLTVTVAKDEE